MVITTLTMGVPLPLWVKIWHVSSWPHPSASSNTADSYTVNSYTAYIPLSARSHKTTGKDNKEAAQQGGAAAGLGGGE